MTSPPTSTKVASEIANQDSTVSSSKEISQTPYCIYSEPEAYFIAITCGAAGFWSAVSGNIFYPVITTIEHDFHITEELANVSVVMYFIFQGLAPMFTASAADTIGRKPVVLFCCVIYTVICCCIAISNAYWLILFLRCFQAASIAPVIAINNGICADLAPPATRGSLVGFTTAIQLIATACGALFGGLLAGGFHTWRAIFWFLAIGSGCSTIISFFFLPETKRSIVGNGSIPPKNFINKSPLWLIPHYRKKLTNDLDSLESNTSKSISRKLLDVPVILSRIEILAVLIPGSICFASWSMMLTSMSTVLQQDRGYTVLHVGICFIAPGVSSCVGSIIVGKVMNIVYKHYDRQTNLQLETWNQTKVGEKPEMDPFKCRVVLLLPFIAIFVAGLLIFGWCLDKDQPLASILIGTILASLVSTPFIAVSMNLVADLYPTMTSTSSACVNFCRCILAAVGIAAVSKMQEKMTIGGCYTFLAGLSSLGAIPIWLAMKNGNRWMKSHKVLT